MSIMATEPDPLLKVGQTQALVDEMSCWCNGRFICPKCRLSTALAEEPA